MQSFSFCPFRGMNIPVNHQHSSLTLMEKLVAEALQGHWADWGRPQQSRASAEGQEDHEKETAF